VVRFYHGFATAVFVPVAEASVAEIFPDKRAERISLFSSVTYVGRGIAPFLGAGILQATGRNFHALYLAVGIAGATALVMALPYLVKGREPGVAPHENTTEVATRMLRGWRAVAKDHGVLTVSLVQACQFYAFGSVEYFLVGYLTEVAKLDILLTGIVSGSLVVMPILAKPYMGRFSDRVGRRIPIAIGCAVSGFPLLAVPSVTHFPVLFLLGITYGFGFASVTASTPALISELVPGELIGTSMGFLDTLMDVGQTIGPMVCGLLLATNLGYAAVFTSVALVLLVAGFIFVLSKVDSRG